MPDAPPVVETEAGRVAGVRLGATVAFLGVPYAAPPVGDRRFRPPAPHAPWAGTRSCAAPGPAAPQPTIVAPPALRALAPVLDHCDEDCLVLNVWAPADGERLPVLVWFHGGGYLTGSSTAPVYDGAALAGRGAVVVTCNYRLGALGFLAHHSLANDGEPLGNWGLLDQLAALRWVRANAAAFGGDPDRVTIFGESSGSRAVLTLLAAEPAEPALFHRAVAQSGPPVAASVDEAAAVADALCARLGVSTPAELRDCPVDRLVAAQGEVASTRRFGDFRFQPVVDGVVLAEHPMEAIEHGRARPVPLIVGTTRDEMALMADAFTKDIEDRTLVEHVAVLVDDADRERAADLVARFVTARSRRGEPVSPRWVWAAIATELYFRLPAIRVAEAHGRVQAATFAYLFDWPCAADPDRFGACHGIDLPFVFGTHGHEEVRPFSGDGPDAAGLAEVVQRAWVAFAADAAPGPAWPAYEQTKRKTMVLGRDARAVDSPREDERRACEEVL